MKIKIIQIAFVRVFIMATAATEKKEKAGYLVFKDYENGQYIPKHEVNNLINYLAGNINAYWSPNRSYYYNWYNESNQLLIVIRWRENNSLKPIGKYGERICYTLNPERGELIDLKVEMERTFKGFLEM